jgi:hypothetical protein
MQIPNRKPDFSVPCHAGALFYWKPDGQGCVEISTLSSQRLSRDVHKKLWENNDDVGFTIISHKSGEELLFVMTDEKRRAGELVWWKYQSCEGAIIITVFND